MKPQVRDSRYFRWVAPAYLVVAVAALLWLLYGWLTWPGDVLPPLWYRRTLVALVAAPFAALWLTGAWIVFREVAQPLWQRLSRDTDTEMTRV